MSSQSIEMQGLPKARVEQQHQQNQNPVVETSISVWAWTSAALLALLSSCLVLFPRFLLFLSESAPQGERRTTLTPLESFLAIQSGIWLSAVSISLLLNIPDGTATLASPPMTPSHPLLGSVTVAGSLDAFIAYNTKDVGSLSTIVSAISGTIGLWGIWVVVFGASQPVSKKTGANKHTSAFLFGNKNAASVQRKEWLKDQNRERRR